MSVVDSVDSYFKYVKARIIAFNSSRTVVGIIQANDWPPKNVLLNSFYLLTIDETTPRNFGTATNVGLVYLVQWVWMIAGDDLTQQQAGKNRGDRYRINFAQMKTELLQGLYPYFCPKNTYGPPANPGTGAVATSLGESIWWSRARFMPTRLEDKTGMLYGAAQCQVHSFTDPIFS